jgi:hypothetical protein
VLLLVCFAEVDRRRGVEYPFWERRSLADRIRQTARQSEAETATPNAKPRTSVIRSLRARGYAARPEEVCAVAQTPRRTP